MKLMIVGDPHGSEKVYKIPFNKADIILLPGDYNESDLFRKFSFKHLNDKISWVYTENKNIVKKAYVGAVNSSKKLLKYIAKQAPVYLVYGNADPLDSEIKKINKKRGINIPLFEDSLKKIKNLYMINYKIVSLDDLVLAGSPYFKEVQWVKRFTPDSERKMKEALIEEKKARKFYDNLPYVDILLCHLPPYGILDKVDFPKAPKNWIGKHAGSKIILDYIKRKKPKYVICGHIHEGKGKKKIGDTLVINAGCAGDYSIIKI